MPCKIIPYPAFGLFRCDHPNSTGGNIVTATLLLQYLFTCEENNIISTPHVNLQFHMLKWDFHMWNFLACETIHLMLQFTCEKQWHAEIEFAVLYVKNVHVKISLSHVEFQVHVRNNHMWMFFAYETANVILTYECFSCVKMRFHM